MRALHSGRGAGGVAGGDARVFSLARELLDPLASGDCESGAFFTLRQVGQNTDVGERPEAVSRRRAAIFRIADAQQAIPPPETL